MTRHKKVTTRDIAKECFVSQSAVSMILSGRTDIHFSEETITLVKETAKKLGYEYKPRTRRIALTQSDTILILCPSLASEYYTTLIQSITERAEEAGLYTLVAHTNRIVKREEYYLQLAEDTNFYGIIYTYPPQAIHFLNKTRHQIPLVMISDYNPQLKIELLELDSKKAGCLIAKHLIELGHRNIAYISTPLAPFEIPRLRRLSGMQEEFKRQGLNPDSIQVFSADISSLNSYVTGNKYYNTGYHLTMEYLKKPTDITAFVGTTDMIAIGIIDALTNSGFKIPKDFSVCGFDNSVASSFANISLTTVDHSIEDKGISAVEMLTKQHETKSKDKKNSVKKKPLLRLEYEPQLIIRGSSGKRK